MSIQRTTAKEPKVQAQPKAPPAIERTSAGLRDAIFDEIDAIRAGTSNPTRANAIAKLSMGIVETVRMEIEIQRHARTMERAQTPKVKAPLGAAVPLGSSK